LKINIFCEYFHHFWGPFAQPGPAAHPSKPFYFFHCCGMYPRLPFFTKGCAACFALKNIESLSLFSKDIHALFPKADLTFFPKDSCFHAETLPGQNKMK
jgi:hypothetical protein